MNVDVMFDNALAVADRIAGRTEMDGFLDFSLDMTQSLVSVDDGIELAAMVKQPGQKSRERQLWTVGPVDAIKVGPLLAAERKAGLDKLAAQYAENPAFELDVDPVVFATGLAAAYRHHTGETPTLLLDDDGEL